MMNILYVIYFLLSFSTVYASSSDDEISSNNSDESCNTQACCFEKRNSLDDLIVPDFLENISNESRNNTIFSNMNVEEVIALMLRKHSPWSNSRIYFSPSRDSIQRTIILYDAWLLSAQAYLSRVFRVINIRIIENSLTHGINLQDLFQMFYVYGAHLLAEGLPHARVAMLMCHFFTNNQSEDDLKKFLWKLATVGENTVAAKYISDVGLFEQVNSLGHEKFGDIEKMGDNGSIAAQEYVLSLLITSHEVSLEEKKVFIATKLSRGWKKPDFWDSDNISDLDESAILQLNPFKSSGDKNQTPKYSLFEIIKRRANDLSNDGFFLGSNWDDIKNEAERGNVFAQHSYIYLISVLNDGLSDHEKTLEIFKKAQKGWSLPSCFSCIEERTHPVANFEQFCEQSYIPSYNDGDDYNLFGTNLIAVAEKHILKVIDGDTRSLQTLFYKNFTDQENISCRGLIEFLLKKKNDQSSEQSDIRNISGMIRTWTEMVCVMKSENK